MTINNVTRSIAVPLYGFSHPEHLFVGREVIVGKLVDLLKLKSRGSYLIAGYRGAGKTFVIDKALENYDNGGKGKKSKLLRVHINLGDNTQLTSLNMFYSMASMLRDEIRDEGFPQYLQFVKAVKLLDNLLERMSFEISSSRTASGRNMPLSVINLAADLQLSKQKKSLPINAREAEQRLIKVLKEVKKAGSKVVFVLDEIDKLSDNEELSEIPYEDNSGFQETSTTAKINTLLGSLKSFITTAEAVFFLISGRETLDRYYSEKGSSNSLYESLFDRVFEVPSFLTDRIGVKGPQLSGLIEEYVCRHLRRKDQEEKNFSYYTLKNYGASFIRTDLTDSETLRAISTLRSFIHYLTFHSWGNPKRLASIFENFIVPKEQIKDSLEKSSSILIMSHGGAIDADRWLLFSNNHLRGFALASEIIALFQHQLSRQVVRISDKLTVSALSSLHFILKLHSYGFTRESLHRMSEAINVSRSPELNTIIDDLLNRVFRSYIRRVRNGIFRYRFNSAFEQELRFISHLSELESATYNFSLDSMRHVKKFFEHILSNRGIQQTGVIARTHITLGDICAIEQSYNAASVHYNTASQILFNVLQELKEDVSQETLMQYIEAMLKHGDLEERRQNYNRAAAIYSDADHIVLKLQDEDLKELLLKGDSKWDLLKQPFWAGRFLSLKRSPKPFEVDSPFNADFEPPRHLYRRKDQRFYYRNANLAFFLGDAYTAANSYYKVLALLDEKYGNSSSELDERVAYLGGKARVGLVESALVLESNNLFKKYSRTEIRSQPEQSTGREGRFAEALPGQSTEREGQFAEELLSLLQPSSNPKTIFYRMKYYIGRPMNIAAKRFEQNRLYISAAITHIKVISYYTAVMDVFDHSTFPKGGEENDLKGRCKWDLSRLTAKAHEDILRRGADAIRCINKARQLETSQSNKTLLIYDRGNSYDPAKMDITKLFDMLLGAGVPEDYPINEPLFWQNSLWAHKLAATLCWAHYVKHKIEQKPEEYVGSDKLPTNLLQELVLRGFSVGPAILLRWVCARDWNRQYIDKKLVSLNNKECNVNDILKNLSSQGHNVTLTTTGDTLISHIMLLGDENNELTRENIEEQETLKKAYLISRYLYFAQESSRIISRKDLDLIFPRLPQLYFAQWKLLLNLLLALLVKKNSESRLTCGASSIRDFSLLLQKGLLAIDKKIAPDERIAPSHFDYEFIYLRLTESLESSISLIDRTSRTHKGVFQHKYFCHDDHSDPDFSTDYTLAYMFVPRAWHLQKEIKKTHTLLHDLTSSTST
jgi:hypothetical protein